MTVISRLQFNHPGNTTRAGYGWHFRLWALIVLYLANYKTKKQKNKQKNPCKSQMQVDPQTAFLRSQQLFMSHIKLIRLIDVKCDVLWPQNLSQHRCLENRKHGTFPRGQACDSTAPLPTENVPLGINTFSIELAVFE